MTGVAYYEVDPIAAIAANTTAAQQARVVGGHAAMWGEATDVTNLLSRVWPRASAVAERLWAPPRSAASDASILGRMHAHRCLLLRRGIAASPVGTLGHDTAPVQPTKDWAYFHANTWCPMDNEFAYVPPYRTLPHSEEEDA